MDQEKTSVKPSVWEKKRTFTCDGGDGIPDFEFTALAVHPDLELHRLQLLPVCVLVAATQEATDVISHDACLRLITR